MTTLWDWRSAGFTGARDALVPLFRIFEGHPCGPYPLLHADARNVLAEIEISENNRDAAVAAATAAYRLAWCDGLPFAYDYGLRTARAHLRTLGAPKPEMPPYDASKHEPIEDVPIDPEDVSSEVT
jgi:hypothetical protein